MIDELEIWEPVIGYENRYEVSNHGRIKSLSREWDNGLGWKSSAKERIRICGLSKLGYPLLSCFKDGKQKSLTVHRLVALAFIENPENKPNVNHKNGVKTDNRVENLEWCTQSENVIHSYKNGFQIAKGARNEAHPKSRPVICLEIDKRFPSLGEASRQLGVKLSHISAICLGKRKRSKGLTFKYA